VFPGGAVDAGEGEATPRSRGRARGVERTSAARPDALVKLSLDHAGEVRIRFDTHFFVAQARRKWSRERRQRGVDLGWFTRAACSTFRRRDLLNVPTVDARQTRAFGSAAGLPVGNRSWSYRWSRA
jgi:hypothetical protein